MNPLTQFKNITILHLCIPLTLGCFALSPMAQAVMPPPDGSYPGQNTAEGQQALFSLTTGIHNTALGAQALFLDHAGSYNTATGSQTLFHNISGVFNTAVGWEAGSGVTTANNVICIGANVDGENVTDSCYIGNIYSNV